MRVNESDGADFVPKVVIDRRHIGVVIMDRMRREILLGIVFALFFIFLAQEPPRDLTAEGYKIVCLFGLCVTLWASNLIPLSITSLLAIAAIPLLGVMSTAQAYSFFGNKAVFFILGAFILSAAMIACGLSARISMWIFETWGSSAKKLLGAIYLFGAVGSCFMSEHAVAAMLYPIVIEIADALQLRRGSSAFGKALFFALAWGCIIGGTATVLGGGRAPLAFEILEQSTKGASVIGLWQYSQLSFPLVLILGLSGWVILLKMLPGEVGDISPARQLLRQKLQAMGRMSFQEKGIAVVVAATLFFWFFKGEELGIANIAIISIVVLFVCDLIEWHMVEEHVNWAIILMYGGAICLGEAMSKSGAALWLANHMFGALANAPTLFLIALAASGAVLTTFMSNSAVVAILLPPAISMSGNYGINPAMAAMAVVISSNFAFALPMGTPASAIAYSSRFIPMREMAGLGALMALLGVAAYAFLLLVYWPLTGFK